MKNLFMKTFLTSGLFILLLFVSYTSSAQYGRHNRGYSSRYYHYDRYPPRTSVSVIARLPFGAASITFGNRYYHYYNGIYYRPYIGGYRIVHPPIGIIVPSLPPGYTSVFIGSSPYYRYDDVYYAPYGTRYKVIEEPNDEENAAANSGTNEKNSKIQKSADNEYEKVTVEGKTYYKKGDKYYKASVNKNGEIVYEEVGEKTKSD